MSRFRLILQSVSGTDFSNPFNNVFYYESTAGTTGASGLAAGFDSAVLANLKAVISNDIHFVNVAVEDLDDPSNFHTREILTNGQGAVVKTSKLPDFVTWSFQYLRASHAVRHGWKRFTGIDESQVENGQANAATLALLQTVAGVLASDISGMPFGWIPRIGRRPPAGGTLNQTILYPITGVVYKRVTTQNSRKR